VAERRPGQLAKPGTIRLPMKYQEFLPHSSLQDLVHCIWILERTYGAEAPYEDVTPDGWVELVLCFGARYGFLRDGGEAQEMPGAFMVGLQKKPLRFRCDGTMRILGVRLHAWAAQPVLGTPAQAPSNPNTCLGSDWHGLVEAIQPRMMADDYEQAVSMVEDHLIKALLGTVFDRDTLRAAANLLYHTKGQVKVVDLAEHCCLSHRQLQRKFKEGSGTTPKHLARVIRFEEIRKRLMFDPQTNLTALAYEFGYSDQSHFIRDFKELSDQTPGEFAARSRAAQGSLRNREDVAFLQVPTKDGA
jgi:AraC-like DNA-binding protein